MALFNKLFSNKRKNATPVPPQSASSLSSSAATPVACLNNVPPSVQNSSSTHQFPFHKNQVRVLLYRDCDWRGRRLLFDSSAIECIEVPTKLDGQMVSKKTQHVLNKTSTKSSTCSSSSSCSTPQNQHVEYLEGCAYKYNRPDDDYNNIGEMLFGSVAMSYRGTALKVHWLKSPNRLMCSQVQLSPVQPQYISPNTTVTSVNHLTTSSDNGQYLNPSLASDISSLDTSSMSSFSISLSVSGSENYNNHNSNKKTVPLDVPTTLAIGGEANNTNGGAAPVFYPHSASDSGYGGTDPWSMARYHYSSTRSSLASIFSDQCENMRKLSIETSSLVDVPPLVPLLPQPTSDGNLNRRIWRNSATSLENSASRSDLVGPISDTSQLQQYSSPGMTNDSLPRLRRNSEVVGPRSSIISGDTTKRKAVSGDAIGTHHLRSHRSSRRSRMGIAICITLSSAENEMLTFCSEHMVLFETILSRLRSTAEAAYTNRQQFLQIMLKGWHAATRWITDLFTAPRLVNPVWITLSYCRSSRSEKLAKTLARKFMDDLNELLSIADTKEANFFISTLLTAVLTHHLGWVGTIAPLCYTHAADDEATKEHKRKMAEIEKCYPYNVLWAQLGDLYGAIGYPLRLSKTLVYGQSQHNQIIDKLLNVLTYFIRCNVVKKKPDYLLNHDQVDKTELVQALLSNQNILNATQTTLKQTIPTPSRGGLKRSPTKHSLSRSNTAFHLDDFSTFLEPSSDPKVLEMIKSLKKNVMNDIPKVLLYRESRMVRQELRIGNKKMDTGVEMNAREKQFLQKYIKATTSAAAKEQIRLTVTNPNNDVEVEEAIQLDLNDFGNETNLTHLLTAENLKTLQTLIDGDALDNGEGLTSTSLDTKKEEFNMKSEVLMRSKSMFVKNTSSKNKQKHLKKIKLERKSSVPKIEPVPMDLCDEISGGGEGAAGAAANGVLFVLGDDEALIGLKPSSSKSENLNVIDVTVPADSPRPTTCKHKYKKHSGVKFNFEQYPQIATNYMKNKNLELPNYDFMEKGSKLADGEIPGTSGFRPNVSKTTTNEPTSDEECECCRENGSQFYLQTPTNASDIEFSNEMESDNYEKATSSKASTSKTLEPAAAAQPQLSLQVNSKLATGKRTMKTLQEENDEKLSDATVIELPLTQSAQESSDVLNKPIVSGFGSSLFAKTSDHYIPDMVLQGITSAPINWEHQIKQDLTISSRSAILDSVPTENVAIVANIEKWDVRVMSSHSYVLSSSSGSPGIVGMSQLVSSMLETVHAMWSCGLDEKQCMAFIESKLREFYLHSETLATFLLATEFCSLSTLTSSLNLTDNDIPLLFSIASIHSPQVTSKYGVSFR